MSNINSMRYGHVLRVNNQILAKNQILSGVLTVGNGDVVMADRTQGSLSVVIQASKDFDVDAGDTLVVHLEQTTAHDGAVFTSVPVQYNKTFDADASFRLGDVVGVLPIAEDVGPWVRAKVSGAATATVDLVLSFVPR